MISPIKYTTVVPLLVFSVPRRAECIEVGCKNGECKHTHFDGKVYEDDFRYKNRNRNRNRNKTMPSIIFFGGGITC